MAYFIHSSCCNWKLLFLYVWCVAPLPLACVLSSLEQGSCLSCSLLNSWNVQLAVWGVHRRLSINIWGKREWIKGIIKKVKEQPTEWENIFANHISINRGKGLVFIALLFDETGMFPGRFHLQTWFYLSWLGVNPGWKAFPEAICQKESYWQLANFMAAWGYGTLEKADAFALADLGFLCKQELRLK